MVEDEPLVRIAIAQHLRECGFGVIEAHSADTAIAALSSADVLPDLIFSDVRMPGSMDGFGLARWVRQHHPDLSVVLASGDAKKVDLANELCAGLELIEKPYDFTMLALQLRNVIAARL